MPGFRAKRFRMTTNMPMTKIACASATILLAQDDAPGADELQHQRHQGRSFHEFFTRHKKIM
jgi:hypothetical protein